jgi:hypothetical protein
MAECTNKEREYLDSIFKGNLRTDLLPSILIDRIPAAVRNRLHRTISSKLRIEAKYDAVCSELIDLGYDKHDSNIIITQITSDAENEIAKKNAIESARVNTASLKLCTAPQAEIEEEDT